MAAFDFIEASSKGYKFLWEERRAIARIAFPAAIIKFISYILITGFDMDQNFLRHGLILLPSFFAEGWLVAYVIRRALYGESLPFQPHREKKWNPPPARFIHAGMAVYVLIWLALSFVNGMVMRAVSVEGVEGAASDVQDIPEPGFGVYLFGIALLSLSMWLFRLLWLYVPVVMGYSIPAFIRRIKGYATSLYMVGTWLICYVPFILILMMFSDMALVAFPSESESVSKAYEFTMAAAKIIVSLATLVAASVAIAYGVQSMMDEGGEKR